MLMGVLRYGRRLTAPPSVDGTWTLITDSNPDVPASCSVLASMAQSRTVMISQSGKSVALHSLDNMMASTSGRLDDQTLKASFPISKADFSVPGCPNSHSFLWTARLDRTSAPTSLAGYWSVEGCPSCASRNVKATRQEP